MKLPSYTSLLVMTLLALLIFTNSCKQSEINTAIVSNTSNTLTATVIPATQDTTVTPIAPYHPMDRYPPYNTLYFATGKRYELKSENSNKLIITLDGGPGWDSALVSIAGGGLSAFEDYEVRLEKQRGREAPFENACDDCVLSTESKINDFLNEPYPDSADEVVSGKTTYRWFNSIMFKRPFDYYVNVEVPVLFIHGERDQNVVVESTRHVEDNLPGKPFSYFYYSDMEHDVRSGGFAVYNKFRSGLSKWLNDNGF